MAHLVGGRYQLIAHLGGGTTAEVSLAKPEGASDPSTLVVVKRLKLGADADPDIVSLFNEEAKLCTRLDHPNIVKAIEAGEDNEGPFLVLEYLDGQTLGRIRSRARRRAGGVPRNVALHIVKELVKGLAYAHALEDEEGKPLKIVHRDVSPENILVTYEGTTKLLDFGVAVAVSANKSRATAAEGKIAYMAPEQVRTGLRIDARADVFAVGLILWELIAGKRIWEGMTEVDVLAHLSDPDKPLPNLQSVLPDVPTGLDAICAQCLAKVRDDRFESAVELLEALENVTTKYAAELQVTQAQIADLLASMFEDERAKMRETANAGIAATPESGRALPRFGSPNAGGLVDVESDPRLMAPGAAESSPQAVKTVVEVVQVEPPPDRKFLYLMALAVVAVFGIIAAVAFRSDPNADKKQPEQKWEPPVRPSATAAVSPSDSAYVEPEEVTIEIAVKPLAAVLFVDGVKAANNPHRVKVVRGKFPHEVRAEAEGFEPRSMTVLFDRDRSIEMALTPVSKTPGAPPPPAPRPGGKPVAPASAPVPAPGGRPTDLAPQRPAE